jgi:hypothetical protein
MRMRRIQRQLFFDGSLKGAASAAYPADLTRADVCCDRIIAFDFVVASTDQRMEADSVQKRLLHVQLDGIL